MTKFPDDFKWGIATSAYQVEGAWNIDGKGPSIWDMMCHRLVDQQRMQTQLNESGSGQIVKRNEIHDQSDGDVACDSYHNIDRDVKMIADLKVSVYRFSLSWPRLLPTGRVDNINQQGIIYYQKLIDALIAQGIEPMVTLYHWDLPQSLQDLGGWFTKEIVTWFGEYARFCFKTFGSKVKYWCTINEPYVITWLAHCDGQHAPMIPSDTLKRETEWIPYLVTYHQLLAHARAYRIYDSEFRNSYKGKIGIVNVGIGFVPGDNSQEAEEACKRARQQVFGIFMHPIFKGDWPECVKERMLKKSIKEGRVTSRLPAFSQQELNEVKDSSDYLGLNYYHSYAVLPLDDNGNLRQYVNEFGDDRPELKRMHFDSDAIFYQKTKWRMHGPKSSWVSHTPENLLSLLKWITVNYGNIEIIITENGCPSMPDEKDDNDENRIDYVNDHLKAVNDAINDGCNITAYILWSLMDNFEWEHGYTYKFGLYKVDFCENVKIRARKSVDWYRHVVETNGESLK